MENKIKNAVEVLVNALKTNEDYRRSWKDNIAMTFKDEYSKSKLKYKTREDIHCIANKAADDFLTLVCKLSCRRKK